MEKYIKDLEKQNEELQSKLAENQLNNDIDEEVKSFVACYIKMMTMCTYGKTFEYVRAKKSWNHKTLKVVKQILDLVPLVDLKHK